MKNNEIDNRQYENELYSKGYKLIGGIDEVGRGPLVGPVVTACVILPEDFVLDGLTDSKKLSESAICFMILSWKKQSQLELV